MGVSDLISLHSNNNLKHDAKDENRKWGDVRHPSVVAPPGASRERLTHSLQERRQNFVHSVL